MRIAAQDVQHCSLATTSRRLAGAVSRQGVVYALLLGVAFAYIAAFAGTGVLRAIYPYPLDGLEGGALQELRRVLSGQPIYVVPSLDYVPMIYGPLYFYLSAVVALVTRSDLLALRATSLLSSLAAMAVLVLIVRRETGSLMAGLVGAAVLGACNQVVSGAMDLGRTDATGLLFMFLAIYAARLATLARTTAWRYSALSGVAMGLAALTKQSSAPLGVALFIALLVMRRNQVVPFVIAGAVTFGGGLLLLVLQSGAWPLYYLWQLPRQHQVLPELMSRFWDHIMVRFAIPVMLSPFFLVIQWRRGDWQRVLFYAAASISMIGSAWTSQATINGGSNVELPAYAAFALLFALSFDQVLRLVGSASSLARDVRGYVLASAIFQLVVMLYNPRLVVPYRSDMWDGDRLSATLAALPGPIFAGGYGGFLDQTTGAIAPDLGAVLEIQGERIRPSTKEGDAWSGELADALANRRITYVLVDPGFNASMVTNLAGAYGYVNLGPLFPDGDKYWDWRTGWSPKIDVYARPDLGRPQDSLPKPVTR